MPGSWRNSWVTKVAQGERQDAGFFDSSVFESKKRQDDDVLNHSRLQSWSLKPCTPSNGWRWSPRASQVSPCAIGGCWLSTRGFWPRGVDHRSCRPPAPTPAAHEPSRFRLGPSDAAVADTPSGGTRPASSIRSRNRRAHRDIRSPDSVRRPSGSGVDFIDVRLVRLCQIAKYVRVSRVI